MRKYFALAVSAGDSKRLRIHMVAIAIVAMLGILAGIGRNVVESHVNFTDPDRLAAMSLLMSGVPENAMPVTFLDVDDRTRKAWGAVGVTPHAALAELVKIAAGKGAASILVDFDITPSDAGEPADPQLSALLRNYPADAPPLMLARTIRFVRLPGQPEPSVSVTPTAYDPDVKGKANIHWVTTLNDIGTDRSVRNIRIWQTACEGASGTAYPSAALVTASLMTGRAEDLAAFLQGQAAIECGNATMATPAWPPLRAAVARLPYVFANNPEHPALFRIAVKDGETVALRRISARLLVSHENGAAAPTGEIDSDPFAGRSVILGASYTDSRDIYETPLGTMPGALILANSVLQARTIIETAPPAAITTNVLAALLFAALIMISRTFAGGIAVLALAVATLLCLVGVSRWLGFDAGIGVISVAVPAFALFKLIDSLITIVMDVPKKGWRAILK